MDNDGRDQLFYMADLALSAAEALQELSGAEGPLTTAHPLYRRAFTLLSELEAVRLGWRGRKRTARQWMAEAVRPLHDRLLATPALPAGVPQGLRDQVNELLKEVDW